MHQIYKISLKIMVRVLDKHLVKSIAASEVVERPGSTLGEL